MIRWIDGETGLPKEAAEKIKEKISQLQAENTLLKERVIILEQENQLLREKVRLIEEGGLGVKKSTDSIAFIPQDQAVAQLTSNGYFKPVAPNVLVIGDQDSYLNDIITANITVASTIKTKTAVTEPNDSELDVVLPKPKKYRRGEGKGGEELGFIAEELPPIVRKGQGYDLKALIAILTYKINKLEQQLKK